ncbi:hypothetical protein [Candidatus Nitronereus thalassa]|uniref:Uncharacterized protein n=1 Tax=Candidatus Nitronereus thalassa TaxID=3020898 RepID=A0ABU3K9E2_9BACT|nr:hypothetical protein [Candidatus Nitronereus thalassa]MDT7043032.1 hypothetical protein [Candidatus Nitronereus thalassa]
MTPPSPPHSLQERLLPLQGAREPKIPNTNSAMRIQRCVVLESPNKDPHHKQRCNY